MLQLSPCGSCYQYIRSNDLPVSANIHNGVKQRCCFATSETKQKVNFAIYWRNHFAQRPFIPSFVHHLYGEIVHSHKDVTEHTWPDRLDKSKQCNTVSVSANNGFAKLELNCNGHICAVDHLVKVNLPTFMQISKSPLPNKLDQSSVEKCSSCEQVNPMHLKRKYLWIKSVFPSKACPSVWKYPFSIALSSLKSTDTALPELINSCHATQPLSNVCKKQFLHVWRVNSAESSSGLHLHKDADNPKHFAVKSLKCVWNNEVMYWIIKNIAGPNAVSISVETWLRDNAVLSSNLSPKYYFTHLVFDNENSSEPTLRRIYSATALPMEPSLRTVLLRAVRLQSYAEETVESHSKQSLNCCWFDDGGLGFGNFLKENNIQNEVGTLHETATIQGLARFSAVSNSVQIAFEDGTTLYVSLGPTQLNVLRSSKAELSFISCRILFSNGQYMECQSLLGVDSHLSTYLNPACDWLLWLSKTKEERCKDSFYSDTIFSDEKHAMVQSELEKINRFKYLLETDSSLNSTKSLECSGNKSLETSNHDGADVKLKCMKSAENSPSIKKYIHVSSASSEVANALRNTNQVIDDIDHLIKSLRT